jgi:hypothetical protein
MCIWRLGALARVAAEALAIWKASSYIGALMGGISDDFVRDVWQGRIEGILTAFGNFPSKRILPLSKRILPLFHIFHYLVQLKRLTASPNIYLSQLGNNASIYSRGASPFFSTVGFPALIKG